MKVSFAEQLRCPDCRATPLRLMAEESDEREVRRGRLMCDGCGRMVEVRAGIADFLDPEDEPLRREVEGWETLAGPLAESLVTTMTALPWYPHPPWPWVAPDFFQIFEQVDFRGARVVDLGAGRSWSSRFLATLGAAEMVVAVDVLTKRFLGLETADLFFAEDGCFFERLRADAHRLPLPDGWADAVVACAAVHHSGDLGRLFAEARRVLKPGGRLIFLSEPSKAADNPARQPVNEETALGINEHIYSLEEYEAALRGAGFRWRRLVPRSIGLRSICADQEFLVGLRRPLRRLAGSGAGRRWLDRLLANRWTGRWLYRTSNLPLTVVARKPA